MCATIAAPGPYSPDDLLAIPDGDHYELVDGQLVEPNVSVLSSYVEGEVLARLKLHSREANLGWVLGSSTLVACFPWRPDLVRKPDVSFVRRDRLTVEGLAAGILRVAPDLAFEVVSPNDEAEALEEKLREYRRAGVRLVWVIYPVLRVARVVRADKTASDLDESDELRGEDVVLGFRCRVGDLFPTLSSEPA